MDPTGTIEKAPAVTRGRISGRQEGPISSKAPPNWPAAPIPLITRPAMNMGLDLASEETRRPMLKVPIDDRYTSLTGSWLYNLPPTGVKTHLVGSSVSLDESLHAERNKKEESYAQGQDV